jgi:hypothetical protein
VAGTGSELTTTVSADAGAPTRADWYLELTLDSNGDAAGQVRGSMLGEGARSKRAWLWAEDPKRWPELLADEMKEEGAPVLDLTVNEVTGVPDSALKLSGSVRYPGIASASGALVSVPVEKFAPWRLHAEFQHEKRAQPIFFRFPQAEKLVVDFHLPTGASLEESPGAGSFENQVGSWRTRWTRIDNGLRFEREIEVRRAEFQPSDYRAVREFFAGLATADRDVILVRMP